MAIPVYDSQKVAPQVAEGARLNPAAGSMEGLQAVARGMGQVADAMQQVEFEASKQVASDKINQFLTEKNTEEANLALLTGEAAVKPNAEGKTPRQVAAERLAALRSTLKEGLDTKAGKMFDIMADPHTVSFDSFGKRHEAQQMPVWVGRKATLHDSEAEKAAVADVNREKITNTNLNSILGSAMDDAAFLQMGPEETKAYIQSRTSKFVRTFAEELQKQAGTKTAKEYRAAAQPYLTEDDAHHLDKLLQVAGSQELGIAKAKGQMDPYAKTRPDSIPVDTILDNILTDKELTSDPEAMRHALQTLGMIQSANERKFKATVNNLTAQVFDVKGGPWARLNSRALLNLDAFDSTHADTVRNHLLSEIEAQRRRDSFKEVKLTPEQQWKATQTFAKYSLNEDLGNVPEDEIKAAVMTLPKELGDHLHMNWEKARTQGRELKTDLNGLYSVARENGLIKGEKPKKGVEAQMVSDLKRIAEAEAPGQKVNWTDKNQQAYFAKLINTKIKTGDRAKGIFHWGEEEIPLFQAFMRVPKEFVDQTRKEHPAQSANLEFITRRFYEAKKRGLLTPPPGGYTPQASTVDPEVDSDASPADEKIQGALNLVGGQATTAEGLPVFLDENGKEWVKRKINMGLSEQWFPADNSFHFRQPDVSKLTRKALPKARTQEEIALDYASRKRVQALEAKAGGK